MRRFHPNKAAGAVFPENHKPLRPTNWEKARIPAQTRWHAELSQTVPDTTTKFQRLRYQYSLYNILAKYIQNVFKRPGTLYLSFHRTHHV